MNNKCEYCPQCKSNVSEKNRIITDSCGHFKCRQCFLKDESHCPQCNQQQESEPELHPAPEQKEVQKHVTITNSKETQQNCNQKVSRKRQKAAILTKHVKVERIENGKLEYHCTICNKRFNSRTQQYYHIYCGNADKKKYKCSECEMHFSSRSHLNYHLESHNSKSYKCPECGKVFTKFIIFKKHQKLHHLTPMKCTECEQVFHYKSSLQAHLAKHKPLFQFTCKLCNKAYSLKSTLHQHMLKHAEKQHECSICCKRFYRNSTLKLHVRRHSKTEKHSCTICLKVFKDNSALLRHNKTHSGTVKYKCAACDITSVRKDNILRHIKNIHEDKNIDICITILNENVQETNTSNETPLKDQFEEMKSKQNLTKTIENSSVIKCIGNVIPFVIPSALSETQPIKSNTKVSTTAAEFITNKLDNNKTAPAIAAEQPISHKNLNKKYNPIEMYRKIINSDKDFSEEDDACTEVATVLEKPVIEQQRFVANQSNFSEMHWRKNLTYQYQDY